MFCPLLSEEIFGCHLDILCKRENVTVPKFVIKCIEAVERRGDVIFIVDICCIAAICLSSIATDSPKYSNS